MRGIKIHNIYFTMYTGVHIWLHGEMCMKGTYPPGAKKGVQSSGRFRISEGGSINYKGVGTNLLFGKFSPKTV